MKIPPVSSCLRRAAVFILAGSIAGLLSAPAAAQTTITYTNGQVDSTSYSVTAPNAPTTLSIAAGSATQSGVLGGTGGLLKAGSGTVILSATNTFTGSI